MSSTRRWLGFAGNLQDIEDWGAVSPTQLMCERLGVWQREIDLAASGPP